MMGTRIQIGQQIQKVHTHNLKLALKTRNSKLATRNSQLATRNSYLVFILHRNGMIFQIFCLIDSFFTFGSAGTRGTARSNLISPHP